MVPFIEVVYESRNHQIFLHGLKMNDGDDFKTFMSDKVASRLYDVEEQTEFESYLRGLSNTDFTRENMDACLVASTMMSNKWWDIGEAIAEAFLTEEHSIIWPWNMSRDNETQTPALQVLILLDSRLKNPRFSLYLEKLNLLTTRIIPRELW